MRVKCVIVDRKNGGNVPGKLLCIGFHLPVASDFLPSPHSFIQYVVSLYSVLGSLCRYCRGQNQQRFSSLIELTFS